MLKIKIKVNLIKTAMSQNFKVKHRNKIDYRIKAGLYVCVANLMPVSNAEFSLHLVLVYFNMLFLVRLFAVFL